MWKKDGSEKAAHCKPTEVHVSNVFIMSACKVECSLARNHTLSNKPCVASGAQPVGLSPDFRLNRPVVLLCVFSVKVGLEHLFFNKWYSWSLL